MVEVEKHAGSIQCFHCEFAWESLALLTHMHVDECLCSCRRIVYISIHFAFNYFAFKILEFAFLSFSFFFVMSVLHRRCLYNLQQRMYMVLILCICVLPFFICRNSLSRCQII